MLISVNDLLLLIIKVSVLNSALNPQTNCEELGGVYDPYPPIVAESPGVSTPDRYSLGSWQER